MYCPGSCRIISYRWLPVEMGELGSFVWWYIFAHTSAPYQFRRIILIKNEQTFILMLSSAPPLIEILLMKKTAAGNVVKDHFTWKPHILDFFLSLPSCLSFTDIQIPKKWAQKMIETFDPRNNSHICFLCSNLQSCVSCWQAPDF